MLSPSLKEEILQLVNADGVQQPALDVIRKIETAFESKIDAAIDEKLKEMGYDIFRHDGDVYFGNNNCEYVDGWIYIRQFNEKNYSVRFNSCTGNEILFDCLVHGETIVGKGNRHYRWFILDAIDNYKRKLKEQL